MMVELLPKFKQSNQPHFESFTLQKGNEQPVVCAVPLYVQGVKYKCQSYTHLADPTTVPPIQRARPFAHAIPELDRTGRVG